MKKLRYLLFMFILMSIYTVSATSGPIKQSSVIECNGKYYGSHGNPLHWHEVTIKNDEWVSASSEVDVPSCYLRPVNTKEKVTFSKCVDGDTAIFKIGKEEKTVRFLAIDTPEVGGGTKQEEPFGKEASNYTCNALKKAKEIVLEYDGNSDKEDKYGRVLAFVYVDNELLEAKLIKKGYAKVAYVYGDYEHVDDLRKLEENAKKNKVGIWGDEIILPDISTTKTNKTKDKGVLEVVELIIKLIDKIFDLLGN